MHNNKLTIIGGGNLGSAIAEGLVYSGFLKPEDIIITRRNKSALSSLASKGVIVTDDNSWAVSQSKWIILAVKPFQIKEILIQILPQLDPQEHVLISTLSGIWIKDIQEILNYSFTVFRAMPNTAIAIRESMTCICYNKAAEPELEFVKTLFDRLGKTVFVEEKLMDAATVLAACGTAYAMRYIRANIQGGIEIGFNAATASLIAAQTIKGAAQLLLTHNTHPEQEIDKVTTPKGCTIAGLNEMEHQGFSSSLIQGITASYRKITNSL